jgi:hypothetical protein
MSKIVNLPPRSGAEAPEAPEMPAGSEFSSIPAVVAELRAGRMVLILDD